MKIGIDARFFGSIGKGLGRYVQKLIENLERIDNENEYVIFLRKENFDDYVPKAPNFKKVLADFCWYGFGEQFIFPFMLYFQKLDIVHFPHFNVPILYRKKIIITIHDLILLHFPTLRATTLSPLWYRIKFLAYKMTIGSAIGRALKVIAVSKSTKRDILKNYSISEDKLTVTYEAVDDFCLLSQKNSAETLSHYKIKKPYLLYVGNAYPHKNLDRLIRVFGQLKKEKSQLNLVLVGKEDFFYRRLKKLTQDEKIPDVIFPGFVSDSDLSCVYRNSSVYVFPSLYEGFGLPPLEAMMCGIPVLSGNHCSMQEILGDSALFCDPKNEVDLLRNLKVILEDKKLQQKLIQKGYARSVFYSWQKMAKDTLELYRNLQ